MVKLNRPGVPSGVITLTAFRKPDWRPPRSEQLLVSTSSTGRSRTRKEEQGTESEQNRDRDRVPALEVQSFEQRQPASANFVTPEKQKRPFIPQGCPGPDQPRRMLRRS